MTPSMLFHFSEDPNIERFVPHVPRTNPTHPPAVWAIDAQHAPLYWFPRDCPRVALWPSDEDDPAEFRRCLGTSARRVHAIESSWLDRMRSTEIYRYELDAAPFLPWAPANGQWIADCDVVPLAVTPVGDLLAAHVAAGIELRITPSLWPMHDLALAGALDFSIVRMHNAEPRPAP
jgi:hypothetical protein